MRLSLEAAEKELYEQRARIAREARIDEEKLHVELQIAEDERLTKAQIEENTRFALEAAEKAFLENKLRIEREARIAEENCLVEAQIE